MKRASGNVPGTGHVTFNGKTVVSAGTASDYARSARVTQHVPETVTEIKPPSAEVVALIDTDRSESEFATDLGRVNQRPESS